MIYSLQKAGIWKRASAWLFDTILLSIASVGFAFLLSAILGYDGYNDRLQATYEAYEAKYGITLDISEEDYLAMDEEKRALYEEAAEALSADEEATYLYQMVLNLTLVILSLGILLAYLVLEFVIPLCLKNGQTLGKKVFGIGLMRTDGVKLSTPALLVRTLLGKYTVETMIPVLILVTILFGVIGLTGTVVLIALLVLQIVLLCATRTNSAIHDLLAGSVAVDIASQKIFENEADLLAYKKQTAAEEAARPSHQ